MHDCWCGACHQWSCLSLHVLAPQPQFIAFAADDMLALPSSAKKCIWLVREWTLNESAPLALQERSSQS